MNFDLLNSMIPQRRVYDAPDMPARKLREAYAQLDRLRAALVNCPPHLSEGLQAQIVVYERALENGPQQ